MTKPSICVLPELKGFGGPSSFQAKLKKGMDQLGIAVHHDIREPTTKALLVIGGTRKIGDLLYAKRKGIRIVQRLDGMNWLHKKKFTGIAHFIRSERMNLQLLLTRRYFADAVVYQSNFTRDWWNTVHGTLRTPHSVIYNGVELSKYLPGDKPYNIDEPIRLLVVEGSFKGGHERDLLNSVDLANSISAETKQQVELLIAGRVPETFKSDLVINEKVTINWLGLVPHDEIPDIDRSAHLIYPAEINAACPNSLIEALSCGLPVVSYATGSLHELVGDDGGIVVPYNGDYWNLAAPDSQILAKAARQVLNNLTRFRKSARKRAEKHFNAELMVDNYRKILLDDLSTL